MSIRIRSSNGITIALCAVESDPQPGDIYLDDGAHHALTVKFEQDFISMGFMEDRGHHGAEVVEMERHKVRDAETVALAWHAANDQNES